MDIVITGRQLDVTPALKRFINQRAKKVENLSAGVSQLTFILKTEKYRHHAEVLAWVDKRLFRADAETENMNTAIDVAITKLETRLKRHTEKRRSLRIQKRGSIRKAEPLLVEPSLVQKRSRQAVASMTLQEAESTLASMKTDLLLFSDLESGQVHLLYRAGDGTFGLIETRPA
jgi:putative sigma-54 modulation protein